MIRKPRLSKRSARSSAPTGGVPGFDRKPGKGRPGQTRFERPSDVGQSQRGGPTKGLIPPPLKPIDSSTPAQPLPLDPVRYETFRSNIERSKRGR